MSVRGIVEDQLDRLSTHWHRLNVPTPHQLAPGLSDQEMDDLTGPAGLVLNDELRAWWGWHNGISDTAIWLQGLRMPSLGEAITLTQTIRVSDQPDADVWSTVWREWIVFAAGGHRTYLAGPGVLNPRSSSMVLSLPATPERPLVHASVSDMLALWLGLLDSGLVTYNPDRPDSPWTAQANLQRNTAARVAL